jgi:cell division protein FtsL
LILQPPQLSIKTKKTTQKLTQKEKIMYGIISVLVLVILLQNFPKIKKWLHEKTA